MSTKNHSTATLEAPDRAVSFKVLVDLDGTVVNLMDSFYCELLLRDPDCIVLDESQYNLFKRFSASKEDVQAVLDLPGFFRHLKPIPGAKEAIAAMISDGFDVQFCSTPTDTNPTCIEDKRESVREHFGDYLAETLILTHDKTEWEAVALIDDIPFVSGEFVPAWEHIHFAADYNKGLPQRRLEGWSDDWRSLLSAHQAVTY
jgi:5'(3')-deoxyribonucleotidase